MIIIIVVITVMFTVITMFLLESLGEALRLAPCRGRRSAGGSIGIHSAWCQGVEVEAAGDLGPVLL